FVPISSIARHPDHPDWLYVGTDVGIFATSNGGRTWSASDYGPAAVAVDELFWRPDEVLYAATHGRGVWRAVIPDDNGVSAHKGDTNGDCHIDAKDYKEYPSCFSGPDKCADRDCEVFDWDDDCDVDLKDVAALQNHYTGPQYPTPECQG
ncbi:MAG: hypothetical protein C4547_16610, partial [Phycisphaerales bacterium]